MRVCPVGMEKLGSDKSSSASKAVSVGPVTVMTLPKFTSTPIKLDVLAESVVKVTKLVRPYELPDCTDERGSKMEALSVAPDLFVVVVPTLIVLEVYAFPELSTLNKSLAPLVWMSKILLVCVALPMSRS